MQKSRLSFRLRLGVFRASTVFVVAALASILVFVPRFGRASDPGSSSIGPSSLPVTWTGTATGTGCDGEGDCLDGINCDTFTLNVAGTDADWAGKYIEIKINWLLPVNDYDLYVHKNSNSGALVGNSGSGAPATDEATAIVPMDQGTGTYTVHVVYFATTPSVDQYHGTATVKSLPSNVRAAIYLKGGMEFSPNRTVKCPVSEADGEPSSRCDAIGNYYVSGIRGVPAGCDLWYFDLRPNSATYDPFMRNPVYRGQPDSFTEDQAQEVGADGGGDVDIAVGNGNGPGGQPTVAFSSLVLSNIFTARSYDNGRTWTKNNAGNITGGAPVDDRQWLEFWGKDKVYLLYRTFQPAVTQVQLSRDGGLTFGPARTAGQIGQVGSVDVDQHDGTVYICGSTGMVGVGKVDPQLGEPTTYTVKQVATDITGVANLFTIVKVADDGTVYYLYCNGRDIMLQHSKDKGTTWSLPVRVSDGAESRASYFPHMETGSLPGSVGITWYGTTNPVDDDNANWQVFYAQSFNASSTVPTFRQARVSDHIIHAANISTGGTLGNANRNLLDYFQVAIDPLGAAVFGYTDDHNDFSGHTFVSRQTSGPSLKDGKKLRKPKEGSSLPAPPAPPADGSQVTDFPNDVAYGLLAVVNQPDPMDILSMKYSTENSPVGKLIVCKMKVSNLSALPDLTNWRVNFTANAPGTGNIGNGYSFAPSDRGDQFWMRAFTRADRTSGSAWGTTTRDSDGGLTYTEVGPADSYSFDQAGNTITIKLAVSKLNLLVRHGPPLIAGSVVAGLRGENYSSGNGAVKRDATRGGTEFTIQ